MRTCWAHYALWAVIALLGVSAMLSSGCGAKGPLYLPQEEEQQERES